MGRFFNISSSLENHRITKHLKKILTRLQTYELHLIGR
ncbi:hypothetical protein CLV24_101242 [Pontibacter ummariensis]|uniref:Uncharacterized protein n=1 Tax=Pontibacter ummariensis TaxID=1610492 RepID=A0A239B927_9BACT|nr:hypothetical protein CLV24_101242 [Pontibacter ummariensis]SNS04447.1 hypothetical protein SAMN06296052_101242 [Pontibacter ummariensis]